MKNTGLLAILILLGVAINGNSQNLNHYQNEFNAAYSQYPDIPQGLLEAVSYSQTRFKNIQHPEHSCIGIPEVQGVMGLVPNGAGYFNNTQSLIAGLANVHASLMGDPATDILAYAAAYSYMMNQNSVLSTDFFGHESILRSLSEIPEDNNPVNSYAKSCFTYEVLNFLRDEENQAIYGFPNHQIDLVSIYGEKNYKVLTSKRVEISEETINGDGVKYSPQNKSADYGPALWVATPTCNYSSRSGTAISAVVVHTIQGSYAGAISWAQNCSANVSYHYVARSTDGQITQMVYEADKGWHVGSANPYTIGIEHEGYVSNPAWYTVAMYTGSANLVKDITQSGYGINPLRTYYGPSSTGTNTLGSCTTIKGHQHYPSQSHTDPGINWNWEYYYQLINDNPTVSTLTATSGVTYDSGGAGGNYQDDERELYLIEPVGVTNVTISFDAFSIEANWDYMYIYDGNSVNAPLMGVYTGTTVPATLTSTGAAILLEFRSDCATQDAGWEISWTTTPGPGPADVIAPTTSVSAGTGWHTTNFTVNFTDADNTGGSGVEHHFYQVIDFDGSDWRANGANGFYSDNFDLAIHPEWTSQTGVWGINASVLEQSDEANVNTNLHAQVNQDNYDKWLYHFQGKISGAGGNKRAGFHFMCDDATLTNRGNSYFIWLRSDDNKVQIYKTINDVFTLEVDLPFTINDNQWYDLKTVYDKTTGEIELYIDNLLAANWVDASPYTQGNAISFRSGDCILQANNIKVYHNRGASELVTINTGNDIQQQNFDPFTHAAKIKSITIDSAQNISSIAEQLVHVDWSSPISIPSINDGLGADINTTYTNTELSANWAPSSDQHSDIASYWYSIGTSPGLTDVVPWTDNWYQDTVTHSGLNLVEGSTYYFCVYAENGAGLYSDTICSDGQTVQAPTATPTANFIIQNSYICSFEAVQVANSSIDAQTYSWTAPGGTPPTSTAVNPSFTFTATGYYDITLTATGPGGTDTDVQTIYVNIDTVPSASYTPSATTVDLSNAFVTFNNSSQHANGYLWDFADGSISTDVSPWHQFTAVGAYDVMLIAVNGNCPNDTTQQIITVIDDLGLSSELTGAQVYPNPTNSEIFIELDDSWSSDVNIQLLDARGRIIYSTLENQSTLIRIDIIQENLTDGVYFLRVADSEKVGTQKILVKRG